MRKQLTTSETNSRRAESHASPHPQLAFVYTSTVYSVGTVSVSNVRTPLLSCCDDSGMLVSNRRFRGIQKVASNCNTDQWMNHSLTELINESELLNRARAGDFRPFQQWIVDLQPRVYALALRILRQSQDAEDATQQIFLALIEHLPEFRVESALNDFDEKYRLVFILRGEEGFSVKDTARILELADSNVKVRLLRARLALRERLTRKFGDHQQVFSPVHIHN